MGYLRPAIERRRRTSIVYDTSALRLRPDRSKEAFELYDRGLLSGEALLPGERLRPRTTCPPPTSSSAGCSRKVAAGSATPEQVAGRARASSASTSGPPPHRSRLRPGSPAPPRRWRTTPTRPPHPRRRRALLAASEALVFRALERAGNRLRQRRTRSRPGCPPTRPTCSSRPTAPPTSCSTTPGRVPRRCSRDRRPRHRSIPVLDSYCTALLSEQSPHTRDRLQQTGSA